MCIKPKDHIRLEGDEYVVRDSNMGTEQRFPADKQGYDSAVSATCGYLSITVEVFEHMKSYVA